MKNILRADGATLQERWLSLLLIFALLLVLPGLVACSPAGEQTTNTTPASQQEASSDKLQVVTTIFPSYDFIRAIAGDKVELKLLLPPGAESHSFEPSPQDLIQAENSDLFIYVGGHSDHWAQKIVENRGSDKASLALLDLVPTLNEEIVEGMEEEEEEESEEDFEVDEHVWTNPQNAIKLVEAFNQTLAELDPANKDYYQERTKDYVAELKKLDQDFEDLFSKAEHKVIIVGDRFPLRYFTERYGLEYYAAFPGCSTEGDASPQTVAFLIDKVKAEQIPVVFHIELSSAKLAETIAQESGAKVALFHSCHNLSPEDFQAGLGYLDLMRQNLDTLKDSIH